MLVRLKGSRRSLHQSLAVGRRRWRRVRSEARLGRYVRVVRTGWSSTVNHSAWVAARAAFRDASLRSRTFRSRRISRRPAEVLQVQATQATTTSPQVEGAGSRLAPDERRTLEVGSAVVLGALGLGLQFGRWPAWTVLAAVGGYLTWVVIYSEATVQARHRRPGARRPEPGSAPSAETAPTPAQE